MPSYSGMSVKMTFVAGPGTPTLELEDISSGIPFAYTGYFVVTSPTGVAIHTGSFVSPDTDTAGGDLTLDVTLPLDASGDIICGTYSLTYYIKNTGTGDVYDLTKSYTYCAADITAEIEYDVSCFGNYITSTDATDYGTGTVSTSITRSHTVVSPAGTGVPDTVSSNASITITPLYTKVYQTVLETTVVYNQGSDVYEEYYIEGYDSHEVICDANLCKLTCQINAMWNQYKELVGCNKTQANYIYDKLLRIGVLFQLYINQAQCGNDPSEIYADIVKIIGTATSDCCGCSDSGPQLVMPASTPSNVVVTGSAPISVSSSVVGSTTTYNVSVDLSSVTNLVKDYIEFNGELTWDGLNNDTATISAISIQGTLLAAPSFGFEFLSGGWVPPYDFHPIRVKVIGFWLGAPSGNYRQFLTIMNPNGGGSPWDFRMIDKQANEFTFELFNTTSGAAVTYQELGIGNPFNFSIRIGA